VRCCFFCLFVRCWPLFLHTICILVLIIIIESPFTFACCSGFSVFLLECMFFSKVKLNIKLSWVKLSKVLALIFGFPSFSLTCVDLRIDSSVLFCSVLFCSVLCVSMIKQHQKLKKLWKITANITKQQNERRNIHNIY